MKIAVAAQTDQPDSPVAEFAGRAPYYLIFDGDKMVQTLKNTFGQSPGAGPGAVGLIAQAGAEMLISGQIGPFMKQSLAQAGLKHKSVSGVSAKDALKLI